MARKKSAAALLPRRRQGFGSDLDFDRDSFQVIVRLTQ
jgi:hypothetical protein